MQTKYSRITVSQIIHTLVLMLALLSTFVGSAVPAVSAQQAELTSLSGTFATLWGDSPDGNTREMYLLHTEEGQSIQLDLSGETIAAAGGLMAMNRKQVTVSGDWSQDLSAQGGAARFQVSSVDAVAADDLSATALVGNQPWISIMCKFNDVAAQPRDLAYMQSMYANTDPALDHYWRQSSYNVINVAGSTASGWYTLPQPRSYYLPGGNLDWDRAAKDCTNVANPFVNFAAYKGINLIFNEELDDFAWGGGHPLNLDGKNMIWPITWLPPWGYENIAVTEHEMGHAFGWPHSYGYQTYDNQWDVMSDTWTACFDRGFENATFLCKGQHSNVHYKDMLGWIAPAQKFTPTWGTSTTILLERSALPATSNYKMVRIPIPGSATRSYVVEARQLTGHDAGLPGPAVIIHEIDTSRQNEARVIDPDLNGNTGDAGAMWTVGETFSDNVNKIHVSVLAATASGFQVNISYGLTLYTISGNAGLSGVTINYTGGSTTTDGSGNYSFTRTAGWTGTVTPSKAGYTFSPPSRSYTNLGANQPGQNFIAIPNGDGYEPDNTYQQAKAIAIGGSQTRSILPVGDVDWVKFTLPVASSVMIETTGVAGGDTEMWLYNSALAQIAYSDDDGTGAYSYINSCGQADLPAGVYYVKVADYQNDNQISSYALSVLAGNVCVGVGLADQFMGEFPLYSGASTRQTFAGANNGPVWVGTSPAVPFIAAERVIFTANGVRTSYSEMMGMPDLLVENTYWLPWYNNVDLNTQLRFANVSNSAGTVQIFIGGVEMPGSPFSLAAGESTRKSFPGINDGPVKLVSNVPIVVAERLIYTVNGVQTSYTEMMALPNSQLDSTYWLPWYDNVNASTQLRFANVSNTTANVRVYIAGQEMPGGPFSLAPNASTRVSFTGINNGAVKIVSNVPIVAAERIIFKVNGINTSYSEMLALPNKQAETTHWLPWYNNVDLATELRIANAGNSLATVHVYIGGVEVAGSPFQLAGGLSTRRVYAGLNKGPVRVVSNVPIAVSERVIYKINNIDTSLTEMMALPATLTDTWYWFPWYNNVDLDTQLRFGRQ